MFCGDDRSDFLQPSTRKEKTEMKKHSRNLEKPSRRDFTKSVAAGFIVAPLASSIGEQTLVKNLLGPPPSAPKRFSGCDIGDIEIKSDHIPPTYFDAGSIRIEIAHKLQGPTTQTGSRPNKYTVSPQAKMSNTVRSMRYKSRLREHRFEYIAYSFESGHKAQLALWLQRKPVA